MEAQGQVVSVKTTANDFIRITVDIPIETAPADIIKWLNQMVRIEVR